MLLGCLENYSGRGCVRELRCLSNEWVEEVDSIELAKPVHSEMTVNTISVLAVLICVDTGAEDELRIIRDRPYMLLSWERQGNVRGRGVLLARGYL